MMENEYSFAGDKNLLVLNNAANFTGWAYSEIKQYLHGNILEIGSGIGTYSAKLIKDFNRRQKIIVSDVDPNHIKKLKIKFKGKRNVSVVKLNLGNQSDFKRLGAFADTAFALNVLEHVEDDVAALNNIYRVRLHSFQQ